MLEKERFLALKKLAYDIREDNKKLFKSFEKMPYEEAIENKDKFINSVVENMDIAFSDGEQGREEKQIFRANILIPDDNGFFEVYSKDKNIRNLMNKYGVNIEDVMSKITELNVYSKYLEEFNEEDDFTDEMVKISPKEAEDLLDEIDDLSSTLENLDLEKPLEETEKDSEEEPKEEVKETSSEEIKKETKPKFIKEESFDDVALAVSNFIDKFDDMEKKISSKDEKIKKLEENLRKLSLDNEKLSLNHEENFKLETENKELKEKVHDLEEKLAKSKEILNKIYKSISRV